VCVTPVLGGGVQPDGVDLWRGHRRSVPMRSRCILPLRCGLAGGPARTWLSSITGGLQGRRPRHLRHHGGLLPVDRRRKCSVLRT
jgi:hypothetical protein